MSKNRSNFLMRQIKSALSIGEPTSNLVGKLYAAEMDRIGDEIDDGLGEETTKIHKCNYKLSVTD